MQALKYSANKLKYSINKQIMKKLLLCISVMLVCTSIILGQERNFTGTVTSDEDGAPLPGVTVTIKGTSIGVITDNDGKYTLGFNGTTGILSFSFIGMKSVEVDIDASGNRYDVVMYRSAYDIDEIVVTALGITREKKALGYSAQDVSGDELKKTSETNFVSALTGKSAGVFVSTSGGNVGASSSITIRGNNSLKGGNEPLFIVDGIPVSNTLTTEAGWMANVDYGNALSDINPTDIESISILKGANAAALYGSRGANGVILITTKSGGNKGFSISFESTTTFSNPLILPEFQNEYGQGGNEQFAYKDGLNGGIMDGVDESFGPPLDYVVSAEDLQPGGRLYWTVTEGIPQTAGQILQLPQFTSPIDPLTGERIPTPWISYPDNVKNFYETGILTVNNVSVSQGGEWGNVRLSLTNSNQKGTLPNTDQKKNIINFSVRSNVTDKFSIETRGTYYNIHSDNLPGSGYTFNNPMMQTIWTARQADWEYMKNNIQRPDGSQINWISRWHDNPYWIQNLCLDPFTRNRFMGSVNLRYEFTDWLNLQVRAGTDYYNQTLEKIRPVGSNPNGWKEGQYYVTKQGQQEINADFLLSARKEIGSGITVSGSFGGNIMNNKFDRQQTHVNKLVVPDVYSVSNAKETPWTNYYKSEKEIQSIYGLLTFEYKDQIYIDVTGRNDWSSTLPAANRSYFYPSVTGSWIFTETFGIQNNIFTFGKLRLGWAQVGNDTAPYQLDRTYTSSAPFGSNPLFSLSNTLPPYDLQNELIESIEIGTDLRFFDNRLGIDLTVYKTSAYNQILDAGISNTAGYSSVRMNAGQLDNKGIEVMFNAIPVRTNNFSWDINVNWSKNKNQVISLNDEIETLLLYSGPGGGNGMKVYAPVGGDYGTIMGKGYVYDNGDIVVGDNGIPLTSEVKEIGNIMPDWFGSISNSFNYKGVRFSFMIDSKWGGDIFSHSNWHGWQTGAYASSAGLNDKGVDQRLPVEDGGGVCFGGVYEDGTPNDTYLFLDGVRWNPFARAERWLYDASYIKLREVSLSYALPQRIYSKLRLKGAEVSVFGRNLAILYSNLPNIDPEASRRSASPTEQGIEYGNIPASRSIGFNIKLSF